MHRIFFSVKRVHLRVIEIGKGLLAEYGLTPARFDMLRVVLEHEPYGLLQSRMRALLGVSGATVSRMLKALENLGFVTRTPHATDRRNLLIELTDYGWTTMDNAMCALVWNRAALARAQHGLGGNEKETTKKLRVLQGHLSSMRKAYGDGAAFIDPWTCAPLEPYHYTTVVRGRIRYGDEDLLAEAKKAQAS
jgi:DNA-binding MarR family transcriptional regulator